MTGSRFDLARSWRGGRPPADRMSPQPGGRWAVTWACVAGTPNGIRTRVATLRERRPIRTRCRGPNWPRSKGCPIRTERTDMPHPHRVDGVIDGAGAHRALGSCSVLPAAGTKARAQGRVVRSARVLGPLSPRPGWYRHVPRRGRSRSKLPARSGTSSPRAVWHPYRSFCAPRGVVPRAPEAPICAPVGGGQHDVLGGRYVCAPNESCLGQGFLHDRVVVGSHAGRAPRPKGLDTRVELAKLTRRVAVRMPRRWYRQSRCRPAVCLCCWCFFASGWHARRPRLRARRIPSGITKRRSGGCLFGCRRALGALEPTDQHHGPRSLRARRQRACQPGRLIPACSSTDDGTPTSRHAV
jgi:hypothetical protein